MHWSVLSPLTLTVLSSAAGAQSFNLDAQYSNAGPLSLPPASYGGPAASPGVWNDIDSSLARGGLVTVDGVSTGASVWMTIGCPNAPHQCDDPATSSLDGLLLGSGCQNSTGTGGARLFTTGSTNPDTVVLNAYRELSTSLTIFLQGNANVGSLAFGDGLRCAGGILKRLYVKSASGGATSAPGAGDPSITARSAALGDTIPPGERRYYQTYYRDSNQSFCPAPQGNTFNSSHVVKIVW